MSQTFQHNLGDKVKCRITGQIGIISSRAEHLFGCARYWIEPQELKDGKPVEGRWADEESIEVIEAGAIQAPRYVRVKAVIDAVANTLRRAGGPTSQPASATGPTTR